MNRPRVVIADDHKLVAEAFAKLIEGEFEVVAVVGDGRQLIRSVQALLPDVVILDVAMPLLNGLDAAEQLKRMSPETKIVMLTMNEDPQIAAEAIRRGASAFLIKSGAGAELIKAVREVMRGQSYITPRIARKMREEWERNPEATGERKLTSRQREVLQLLAEGQSMKEVGATLQITTRTVAFHKYKIMGDFRLRSNAELVRFAIKELVVPREVA